MIFKMAGLIAAILTMGSFLPQAIQIIKTKETNGISLSMYVMFNVGVLLWVIYGIYKSDFAIVFANAIAFVLSSIIFLYKIKNTRNQGGKSK